jgi:hypothetical protein
MRSTEEIEAEIRADNPSSTDDAGNVISTGDSNYESLIAQWVAAKVATEVAPAPIPESVLSHQLFTSLSRNGISEATIQAVVAGMPEGQAKIESDIAFRRAPQIRRDHPIALGIAQALQLTSETVDEIFREAAEI